SLGDVGFNITIPTVFIRSKMPHSGFTRRIFATARVIAGLLVSGCSRIDGRCPKEKMRYETNASCTHWLCRSMPQRAFAVNAVTNTAVVGSAIAANDGSLLTVMTEQSAPHYATPSHSCLAGHVIGCTGMITSIMSWGTRTPSCA